MSAPAANARGLPVITIAPTWSSASKALSAASVSIASFLLNAFRLLGRFSVMIPTRSRRSTMIVSGDFDCLDAAAASPAADDLTISDFSLVGDDVFLACTPAASAVMDGFPCCSDFICCYGQLARFNDRFIAAVG